MSKTPKTPKHTERLNILVIGSTYPRHENDYAVPWMRTSHQKMAEQGHQVTVLAPSYRGMNSHQIDGIPVRRFRYAPASWERLTHEQGAPNKINNPLMQLLALPYVICGCIAAYLLARREKFDVIHVHWPFPHQPMGWVASKVSRAPLVLMSHGAGFALARRKSWVKSILRRCLLNADALIANSNDTAKQIRELCGRDAAVVPYGSTVQPKTVQAPKNPRPRLLFTGRLIQRKGVEYLLRALPQILEHHEVDLIITGNGDQREFLERETTRLKITERVSFLGFVSTERLNEEYARCDIWINPSVVDDRGDTEGLGVGSIEAYAHSKPVVASAVGGIPDTVDHGTTGWLVPEKDPTAIAERVIDLLNNPEKSAQFGQAGLAFAQSKFNWHTITLRLATLFDNARAIKHSDCLSQPRFYQTATTWAKVAAVLLIATAIASAIAKCGAQLPDPSQIQSRWLIGGFIVCLTYRIVNATGWSFVLSALGERLPTSKAMRIWLTSEACRWLPGSLWSYGSRAYQANQNGVSKRGAGASLVLELGLTVLAWSITAFLALSFQNDGLAKLATIIPTNALPQRNGWMLLTAFAAAIGLGGTAWMFTDRITPKLRLVFDRLALLKQMRLNPIAIATTLLCIVNGIASSLVFRATTGSSIPLSAIIGANAVAWLVGFFAIMAPGGLVVREGAMATILLPWLPIEQAIGAAIVWRLIQVSAEVVCVLAVSIPLAKPSTVLKNKSVWFHPLKVTG
jgi:glycosyltransferase involved in cell wall biosynthesis